MIQGSINQLLTMAAAGIRLSPGYEARQQELQANKQLQAVEGQIEQMNVTPDDLEFDTSTGKAYKEAVKTKAEVSKRKFEARPTPSNYQSYLRSREEAYDEPTMVFRADPEEIAYEQAEMAAQNALARREKEILKTRESLMSNTPTPMTGKKETIKYGNI